MKNHYAVTMAMGTNAHVFDCGRGYGETKSPSSCKWPVTQEGVIVLHCETCSEREKLLIYSRFRYRNQERTLKKSKIWKKLLQHKFRSIEIFISIKGKRRAIRMDIKQIKENKIRMIHQFSIPSIFAMLLQTVITITDGYFTGNYVGQNALAAINLGLPILYFYFGTGLCIGVGGSVIPSQSHPNANTH